MYPQHTFVHRRALKTWHKVAADKVVALMNHDLVKGKSKWAAGIKELREMFVRVEQDGFSMQSQAVWRLHWDHQIYKVRSLNADNVWRKGALFAVML